MDHQLKVALAALLGVLLGAAVIVLGLVFTLPWLTKGFGTGALLTQRGKLLRELERGEMSASALARIEAITKEMLAAVTSQHMKEAVQRELESIAMARQALERGDGGRAREFLERVGRRMVRFEF
jgi:hypothetical protein